MSHSWFESDTRQRLFLGPEHFNEEGKLKSVTDMNTESELSKASGLAKSIQEAADEYVRSLIPESADIIRLSYARNTFIAGAKMVIVKALPTYQAAERYLRTCLNERDEVIKELKDKGEKIISRNKELVGMVNERDKEIDDLKINGNKLADSRTKALELIGECQSIIGKGRPNGPPEPEVMTLYNMLTAFMKEEMKIPAPKPKEEAVDLYVLTTNFAPGTPKFYWTGSHQSLDNPIVWTDHKDQAFVGTEEHLKLARQKLKNNGCTAEIIMEKQFQVSDGTGINMFPGVQPHAETKHSESGLYTLCTKVGDNGPVVYWTGASYENFSKESRPMWDSDINKSFVGYLSEIEAGIKDHSFENNHEVWAEPLPLSKNHKPEQDEEEGYFGLFDAVIQNRNRNHSDLLAKIVLLEKKNMDLKKERDHLILQIERISEIIRISELK
jgi:hypothetical protein